MTAHHDTAKASARDRILDAAEGLICTRGIAGFTLDAVAAAAGISKGGLLYHFSSKNSLIDGLQRRMASRLEDAIRDAESQSEPILQAFVRRLREDYERGGQGFAALLLAREQENPCQELLSLLTCLARRSGVADDNRATLLLLASLGLILSSLARLPCPEPQQAAKIFDELEAMALEFSI